MPEFTININRPKCAIWSCDRPEYSSGLCSMHYQNIRRHGDPIAPRNVDAHRLRAKTAEFVDKVEALIDDTHFGMKCIYCGQDGHTPDCLFMQVAQMLPEMRDAQYGAKKAEAAHDGV